MTRPTNSTPLNVRNADRNTACPVCKRSDWCSFLTDLAGEPTVVFCRTSGKDEALKRDKTGAEFWLHILKEDGQYQPGTEPPKRKSHDPARAEHLHEAYTAFLSVLPLMPEHRENLRARGYSDEDIEVEGFRSTGNEFERDHGVLQVMTLALAHPGENEDRWNWVDEPADVHSRFLSIPGFCFEETRADPKVVVPLVAALVQLVSMANGAPMSSEDLAAWVRRNITRCGEVEMPLERLRPSVAKHKGMYMPIRDALGRIISLQVRRDGVDDDKYRPLSSPVFQGSSPGLRLHFPLGVMKLGADRVRCVEGKAKADLTMKVTGERCLGFSNANAWAQVLPVLKEWGTRTVILPFDGDVSDNPRVSGSMARFASELVREGFEIEVEAWDPKSGKGRDDVVAAGHGGAIRTLRGREMWEHIRLFLSSSGASKNDEVEARLLLSDLVDRAREDKSYVYEDRILEAVLVLGEGRAFQRLLSELKDVKVPLTEFKRTIEKRRREASTSANVEAATKRGKLHFERGDQAELAVALIDHIADRDKDGRPRHESVVFADGALRNYVKSKGIWTDVLRPAASTYFQNLAGSPVGNEGATLRIDVHTVKGSFDLACDRVHKADFFNFAPMGMAFKNGFLSISKNGLNLRHHQLDDRSVFRYEWDWLDVMPPDDVWTRFLNDIFRDDEDRDAKIAYLEEYLGASLLGIAPTYCATALILLGDGNNGKSKLMEVVQKCFPTGSVSGIAPHLWRSDYHAAGLAGKLLNIVGELPAKELTDSEIVKQVITGEQEVIARNPYEKPFAFRPRCGQAFNANRLVIVGDHTLGFWRRPVVITFNRVFAAQDEDKAMAEKLMANKAGIVARLLQAGQRVLARGRICAVPPSSVETKAEWMSAADPVRRFFEGQLDLSMDNTKWMSGERLYNLFSNWAITEGHKNPPNSVTFGERAKAFVRGRFRETPAAFARLSAAQLRSVERDGYIRTETARLYPVMLKPLKAVTGFEGDYVLDEPVVPSANSNTTTYRDDVAGRAIRVERRVDGEDDVSTVMVETFDGRTFPVHVPSDLVTDKFGIPTPDLGASKVVEGAPLVLRIGQQQDAAWVTDVRVA